MDYDSGIKRESCKAIWQATRTEGAAKAAVPYKAETEIGIAEHPQPGATRRR